MNVSKSVAASAAAAAITLGGVLVAHHNQYTYDQKRIAMVSIISKLDNELLTTKEPGNRHAIQLQLAVMRESLRNLDDNQQGCN